MASFAITGASGFVGTYLAKFLLSKNHKVKLIHRGRKKLTHVLDECLLIDYTETAKIKDFLIGTDFVIHLAGLAHNSLLLSQPNSYKAFHRANVDSSKSVAIACRLASVKTLIFLSTISVLGEKTKGKPFSHLDPPKPLSPYATSKLIAEECIKYHLHGSDVSWIILRPPLIYGPSCPGNLARLFSSLKKVPISPFAGLTRLKYFISIYNLCDAIEVASRHPSCERQTFPIADFEPTSTSQLSAMFLITSNRTFWLNLSVPELALFLLFLSFGKSRELSKLSSELLIDSSFFANLTRWSPRLTLHDSLPETIKSFL